MRKAALQKLLEGNEDILYYYEQGFQLGYEEAKMDLLYKMANHQIENSLIAKIIGISIQDIKELLK